VKPCHSKSHDHRGWRKTTCWHSSHFFLHWDLLASCFTTFCHLCCNKINLKWRHDVPANGCWVNHTFASKNKVQPTEWATLRCFAPIGSGAAPKIFWQAWTSLARKNTLAYFEVLVTKKIKFVKTLTPLFHLVYSKGSDDVVQTKFPSDAWSVAPSQKPES
jgi:hypothetical protein